MEDAIERTTKEKNHAFFKQFKRKQPTSTTDFKGAGGAAHKNTRADDAPNDINDAMPSASTAEVISPTILGNENENESGEIPEIHLNATLDALQPPNL